MNTKRFIRIFVMSIIIILCVIFALKPKDAASPHEEASLGLEEALITAIDDEYKARATYLQVLEDFGDVAPFVNIVNAESQHIKALEGLFVKYDMTVPEDSWQGNVNIPGDLTEVCALAVTAEIDNAALYKNRLIPSVSEYKDVVKVFENLMSASENNHLPAFERCAS